MKYIYIIEDTANDERHYVTSDHPLTAENKLTFYDCLKECKGLYGTSVETVRGAINEYELATGKHLKLDHDAIDGHISF